MWMTVSSFPLNHFFAVLRKMPLVTIARLPPNIIQRPSELLASINRG